MKHAARVASLWIQGSEAFLRGNEMFFQLTFREPYNAARLLEAFEKLLLNNPPLNRLIPSQDLIAAHRAEYEVVVPDEELLNDYVPTGAGLPYRLRRQTDRRVALIGNHAYNNGASTFYWVEHLLAYYDGVQPTKQNRPPLKPNLLMLPHLIPYLAGFLRGRGDTVDLSRGATPQRHAPYEFRSWSFTENETTAIVANAKQRNLTVTEFITLTLAEELFAAQPEKSRICISVPTDLTAWATPDDPGNHTGSLMVQLFRSPNLAEEVKAAYRWAPKQVHYWLPTLIGLFTPDAALLKQFAAKAALPIPQRAPFENFSCALSNTGVLKTPLANKYLSEIAAIAKTQTLFLIVMTVAGRMSWRCCITPTLYNPDEVYPLIDRVTKRVRIY